LDYPLGLTDFKKSAASRIIGNRPPSWRPNFSESEPSTAGSREMQRPHTGMGGFSRRDIEEALAEGQLALARVKDLMERPPKPPGGEGFSQIQASFGKVEAWIKGGASEQGAFSLGGRWENAAQRGAQPGQSCGESEKEPQAGRAPGGVSWEEWLEGPSDRAWEPLETEEEGGGEEEAGPQEDGWGPPIESKREWEEGGVAVFHVDWAKVEEQVKEAREKRWREVVEEETGEALGKGQVTAGFAQIPIKGFRSEDGVGVLKRPTQHNEERQLLESGYEGTIICSSSV
jgi:hypothetical protein